MNSDILSVLIVDDELPIRRGLSVMDWQSFGTVLVGEASNGLDAYNFCKQFQPDIVITDITMPQMDGLDLFMNLKAIYPNIQVIILTCHSDFGYAKEALRLGAVDYVVKAGMDERLLAKAIERARQNIEKEWSFQKSTCEAKRREHAALLNKLITEEGGESGSIFKTLADSGLKISFPARVIQLFCTSRPGDFIFVNEETAKNLEASEGDFYWIQVNTGVYTLFYGKPEDSSGMLTEKLECLIAYLQKQVEKNLHYLSSKVYYHATVSGEVSSVDEFVQEFSVLEKLKDYKFYYTDTNVFFNRDENFQSMNHTFADELDAVIAGLADSNEKPDVCSWKRLSQWAAGKLIVPTELKEAVVKAIGRHSAGNKENYGISKGIWQAQTMSELTDAIRHILELENSRQHKYRREINSAIEIIKGNLDKPLGLSAIAEEVGISSRYLSRLFSDELGESFIDYVTRTRMEKAVELLKTTNMKVYEISEKIGIPSYRYFSAIFKNWTGKTPKEFKRI